MKLERSRQQTRDYIISGVSALLYHGRTHRCCVGDASGNEMVVASSIVALGRTFGMPSFEGRAAC